jgi:hypothetical protein
MQTLYGRFAVVVAASDGVGAAILGDHPKAAIGYHFKTGHRETA